MKVVALLLIKAMFLIFLMSQATTSETGSPMVGSPVNELVFLTLCGLALFTWGVLSRRRRG